MKIAFAGKGGVGKTTLCAWTGDLLARRGHDVLMVDADTALSLGLACGLDPKTAPVPLIEREDLVRARIGSGILSLTPDVSDLPDELCLDLPVDSAPDVRPGRKRLLVMGALAGAGDGCACAANALLKALLAHLVTQDRAHVLVDLEAGVEHLGRGTVADVDGLVVVSEPSARSLDVAARVSAMARGLGLARQALALNRSEPADALPPDFSFPDPVARFPALPGLRARQLTQASVLGLPERPDVDRLCAGLLSALGLDF